MNNIFQKIGLSLIVLGIGFYLISDSGSMTALIPSFLGAIICGFVFLAGKFPNQQRHFAHANLLVFAMGCGATYKSVGAVCAYLLHGETLTKSLATIEQFTTFVLCLSAIILGVKSFVDARKK
tara:strand:+ start:379 stop:747 length:369 start_codon:yes stop_codon:yes gene_type:complete